MGNWIFFIKDKISSNTRLPSNQTQTTHKCVYLVTYGKPMNIHSMPMALYNLALIWQITFPIITFARPPQWRNALAGAAVVVMLSLKHTCGRITFHGLYTSLTHTPWRSTGWTKMNFACQGFLKLSSDRQTDRHDQNYYHSCFAGGNYFTTANGSHGHIKHTGCHSRLKQ